jgi:hypothetical protein
MKPIHRELFWIVRNAFSLFSAPSSQELSADVLSSTILKLSLNYETALTQFKEIAGFQLAF